MIRRHRYKKNVKSGSTIKYKKLSGLPARKTKACINEINSLELRTRTIVHDIDEGGGGIRSHLYRFNAEKRLINKREVD